VEFGDYLASLDEGWYASFDRRDRDGLRFREQVPPDCHEARDRSGRRNPLKVLGVGLFGASSAGRPLADDAERASEATRRQVSPKFSTIPTAGRPLIVEPWQMQVQRTLPGPEDIVALAADHGGTSTIPTRTSMFVPVKSFLVSSVRLLVCVCATAENEIPSPMSAIKPACLIILRLPDIY
jgi:hypothetical protein